MICLSIFPFAGIDPKNLFDLITKKINFDVSRIEVMYLAAEVFLSTSDPIGLIAIEESLGTLRTMREVEEMEYKFTKTS